MSWFLTTRLDDCLYKYWPVYPESMMCTSVTNYWLHRTDNLIVSNDVNKNQSYLIWLSYQSVIHGRGRDESYTRTNIHMPPQRPPVLFRMSCIKTTYIYSYIYWTVISRLTCTCANGCNLSMECGNLHSIVKNNSQKKSMEKKNTIFDKRRNGRRAEVTACDGWCTTAGWMQTHK